MRRPTEKFLPKPRGKNRKKEIRCGMALKRKENAALKKS